MSLWPVVKSRPAMGTVQGGMYPRLPSAIKNMRLKMRAAKG